MTHSVTLRHNFETGHRLPHLGGKCRNLHGHSWWVEMTITAPALTEAHTVVEFGTFKRVLRQVIDACLDHGVMLGAADPLLPALRADGTKVFVFGQAPTPEDPNTWEGAAWPTVEAVALMLADWGTSWLLQIHAPDVPVGSHISRVRVTETHVNAAEWTPSASFIPPQRHGGLETKEAQ